MKDESKILDWRSTGRRKGRRTLYNARTSYHCVGYRLEDGTRIKCRKTSKEPPKDAPHFFEDIWPAENRVLDSQLQADHQDKNYRNNDLENLEWKCVSCHRIDDSKTEKGVAQVSISYWPEQEDYSIPIQEGFWP